MGIGAVVALVLLLLAWAFVIDRDGDERADVRAEVGDEDSTSTTTTETETTALEVTTTSVSDSSTTTGPDTSTTAAPETAAPSPPPTAGPEPAPPGSSAPPTSAVTTTTTTTPTTTTEPCLDSYEARCGPFSWASSPGSNRAATWEYEVHPERPVVGEEVRITITVADTDAVPRSIHVWRGHGTTAYCGYFGAARAHGPWQVPPRTGGTKTQVEVRTFSESGVQAMTLCFSTSSWTGNTGRPPSEYCPGGEFEYPGMGWRCLDPYGEHTKIEFQIEVFPA